MKKDAQLNGSIYINSKNVFVPNLYCSVGTLSLIFTSFIASLGQLVAQTPHPKQYSLFINMRSSEESGSLGSL